MRRRRWPAAALWFLCLCAAILTGCRFIDGMTASTPMVSNLRGMAAGLGVPLTALPDEETVITPAQLQSTLMAYADEYMARLTQAADDITALDPDNPHLRLRIHSRKLYNCMAAQSIASGPNPEVALLDMTVLVTLDHLVISNVVSPEQPGADALYRTLAALDEEIWAIANAILSDEQADHLRQAIDEYHTRNPQQREVSFVRFTDFAGSRHQSTLIEAVRRGILPSVLPSVDEAARAVDETRLVAERALHLMEKMPIFISWQAELMLYELAVTPEMERFQGNLGRMTNSAEMFSMSSDRFSRSFETLANQISTEQSAVLEALDDQASQMHLLMEDARATMASAETLLADVRQSSERVEALVDAVGEASVPLGEAAERIDRMLAHFDREPGERDPDAKPFDIEDYTRALGELTTALREANTLLDSTQSLLESATLERVNASAIAVVDHTAQQSRRLLDLTFWRGLILIAAFWGLALISLVAYRRLTS